MRRLSQAYPELRLIPAFSGARRGEQRRLAYGVLYLPSEPHGGGYSAMTKKTLGTLITASMLLLPSLALANEPAPGNAPKSGEQAPAKKKAAHKKDGEQKKDEAKK